MKTLVFFLEEPSAEAMLKAVLPRVLPENIQVRYIVFQGKQNLEKNLNRKLRGWSAPDSYFVVMRDQDSGDCREIKSKLLSLCQGSRKERVLIRIACRELESFYLGDLAAVELGLGAKGLKQLQNKAKFRDPDSLGNPSNELLMLTNNKYQKLAGSRAIGPHMNLLSNRSLSFKILLSGIHKLLES